jgi:hypothetical protein
MVLDGLNNVLEVRINDMEGGDIPKYGKHSPWSRRRGSVAASSD